VALSAYRALRERVLAQTPRETLAGVLANLALAMPSNPSPILELVTKLRVAALDADLSGG